MAVTLRQDEAQPAQQVPDRIQIASLGDVATWQRIEAHIARRYTPRAVVWIVEGEGDWTPPLAPATIETVEVWERGAWTETAPPPSPLGGLCLPGDGPYRVTATVGGGEMPEAVSEAFRRFSAYLADSDDAPAGSNSYRRQVGEESTEIDRNPAWIGRALQHSGAADLLRPYRRA